jgi:hypothetical protein
VLFGTSDRHVSCLFVEVTPATATPETTLSWLRANLSAACPPTTTSLSTSTST